MTSFLATLTLAQVPLTEPRAKVSAEGIGVVESPVGHLLVLQVESSGKGTLEAAQADLANTIKRVEALFKQVNLDFGLAVVTNARMSVVEGEFDPDHRRKPNTVTLNKVLQIPMEIPGDTLDSRFVVLASLTGIKGVSGGIQFKPDLTAKLDEARTLSLEAARRSAEAEAKALGYKLGRLLSVTACGALQFYPMVRGDFTPSSASLSSSGSVLKGANAASQQSSCSSRVEYELIP